MCARSPPLIPPPPHPEEVDRMSSLLLQGRQTLRAHVHVKNQSAIENRRVCTTLATNVNEASYLHMCTHTKNVVNIQTQYDPRRYYRVRVLLRNLSQKRRLHCGFFPSKGNWKRWWMSNLLAMMLILQLTDRFTVDILTSLSVHVKFQYQVFTFWHPSLYMWSSSTRCSHSDIPFCGCEVPIPV